VTYLIKKRIKQKDLLTKLQVSGTDICMTSLSQLEGHYRYARNFEVFAVSEVLGVDIKTLFERDLTD